MNEGQRDEFMWVFSCQVDVDFISYMTCNVLGYGLEIDMWALGVITYILLCGFPPFRSTDRKQTELFEFIKSGEFEFLSPYWDNNSKSKYWLRMLISVCLAYRL